MHGAIGGCGRRKPRGEDTVASITAEGEETTEDADDAGDAELDSCLALIGGKETPALIGGSNDRGGVAQFSSSVEINAFSEYRSGVTPSNPRRGDSDGLDWTSRPLLLRFLRPCDR